jgi:hypothetical protein
MLRLIKNLIADGTIINASIPESLMADGTFTLKFCGEYWFALFVVVVAFGSGPCAGQLDCKNGNPISPSVTTGCQTMLFSGLFLFSFSFSTFLLTRRSLAVKINNGDCTSHTQSRPQLSPRALSRVGLSVRQNWTTTNQMSHITSAAENFSMSESQSLSACQQHEIAKGGKKKLCA